MSSYSPLKAAINWLLVNFESRIRFRHCQNVDDHIRLLFLSHSSWFKIILKYTIQDTDRSGTISFSGACVFLMLVNTSSTHGWSCSIEFAGLWKYLSDWQNVFRHFDRDRSGTIEGHELASALQNFGYALSPQLINLVEQKYCLYPIWSKFKFGAYQIWW